MSEKTTRKKFYVKKQFLLLIAGIVWIIAGSNVARIGISAYIGIETKLVYYVYSLIVFILFGIMFTAMTKKHTKRILGYEEYRPFWNFFDIKSYIIMVIMMGGGIGLRVAGVLPEVFVAFFYSGLGCALFQAGILFIINFIKSLLPEVRKQEKK